MQLNARTQIFWSNVDGEGVVLYFFFFFFFTVLDFVVPKLRGYDIIITAQ